MADEADIAQDSQEREIQFLLSNRQNRVKEEILLRDGVPYCVECGEEIPMKRFNALGGCSRCVDCQRRREE